MQSWPTIKPLLEELTSNSSQLDYPHFLNTISETAGQLVNTHIPRDLAVRFLKEGRVDLTDFKEGDWWIPDREELKAILGMATIVRTIFAEHYRGIEARRDEWLMVACNIQVLRTYLHNLGELRGSNEGENCRKEWQEGYPFILPPSFAGPQPPPEFLEMLRERGIIYSRHALRCLAWQTWDKTKNPDDPNPVFASTIAGWAEHASPMELAHRMDGHYMNRRWNAFPWDSLQPGEAYYSLCYSEGWLFHLVAKRDDSDEIHDGNNPLNSSAITRDDDESDYEFKLVNSLPIQYWRLAQYVGETFWDEQVVKTINTLRYLHLKWARDVAKMAIEIPQIEDLTLLRPIPRATQSTIRKLLRNLGAILVPQRLLEALGDRTRLIISPYKESYEVPWNILIDQSGHYLFERLSISLATSSLYLDATRTCQSESSTPIPRTWLHQKTGEQDLSSNDQKINEEMHRATGGQCETVESVPRMFERLSNGRPFFLFGTCHGEQLNRELAQLIENDTRISEKELLEQPFKPKGALALLNVCWTHITHTGNKTTGVLAALISRVFNAAIGPVLPLFIGPEPVSTFNMTFIRRLGESIHSSQHVSDGTSGSSKVSYIQVDDLVKEALSAAQRCTEAKNLPPTVWGSWTLVGDARVTLDVRNTDEREEKSHKLKKPFEEFLREVFFVQGGGPKGETFTLMGAPCAPGVQIGEKDDPFLNHRIELETQSNAIQRLLRMRPDDSDDESQFPGPALRALNRFLGLSFEHEIELPLQSLSESCGYVSARNIFNRSSSKLSIVAAELFQSKTTYELHDLQTYVCSELFTLLKLQSEEIVLRELADLGLALSDIWEYSCGKQTLARELEDIARRMLARDLHDLRIKIDDNDPHNRLDTSVTKDPIWHFMRTKLTQIQKPHLWKRYYRARFSRAQKRELNQLNRQMVQPRVGESVEFFGRLIGPMVVGKEPSLIETQLRMSRGDCRKSILHTALKLTRELKDGFGAFKLKKGVLSFGERHNMVLRNYRRSVWELYWADHCPSMLASVVFGFFAAHRLAYTEALYHSQ